MNKEVTKAVLSKLTDAWPKKRDTLTTEEANVWHESIGHLEMDVAKRAAAMVIAECEWFPTIAKYLECARSILRAQEASLAHAPPPLTEYARKLQEQALSVQRQIAERRGNTPNLNAGHSHGEGWLSCPICVQAHDETEADSCAVCMLTEDAGLHATHS